MQQAEEKTALQVTPRGWRSDPLAAWLITELHRPNAELDFFAELCERLAGEGIDIARAFCGLLSLHPLFVSRNLVWTPETGSSLIKRPHGVASTDFYYKSPVYLIHQGAPEVRQRLDVDEDLLEFDIWKEGRAQGMTDYVAVPLRHSTGEVNVLAFSTRRRAGFTPAQIARLKDIAPLIALRMELMNSYFATGSLLNTYLGEAAARRVLAGTIHRAEGETLTAAVYLCDLKGFTALSEQLEAEQIIEVLDDYFDCMIEPIRAMGGEVLKFMGDGMLAIFPMDSRTAQLACQSALAAAEEGQRNLAALNRRRCETGKCELSAGIGLHVGEVIFGNIGSADRLDFTVIGRAVNEVSRVEGMTRALRHPILMTAEFATVHADGRELQSLGFHALSGVTRPTEIFAPA
ncbi:MAG: adenylate/guanylate cyclase domain-containing protein [Minwuia sp.]|uniref:adenylate/guanylate cyclase domain-containing protein n=1 Tax=Minwuia sp. TaxID=2493630 RepID=UPI003A880E75